MKLVSTDTVRMQQALQTAEAYTGNTDICFYFTDKKRTVQPKQKIGIAVTEESEQALQQFFSSAELGILK